MANGKTTVEKLKELSADAQALIAALLPKAATNADLTAKELKLVTKLIDRADALRTTADGELKAQQAQEIQDLQTAIGQLDAALAVPGLPAATREALKTLQRSKRGRLGWLQTQVAMDFGGILSAQEVTEIATLIQDTRKAVAQKKKAATHLALVMKVADVGLGLASRFV